MDRILTALLALTALAGLGAGAWSAVLLCRTASKTRVFLWGSIPIVLGIILGIGSATEDGAPIFLLTAVWGTIASVVGVTLIASATTRSIGRMVLAVTATGALAFIAAGVIASAGIL
jgi:hypothetical protein